MISNAVSVSQLAFLLTASPSVLSDTELSAVREIERQARAYECELILHSYFLARLTLKRGLAFSMRTDLSQKFWALSDEMMVSFEYLDEPFLRYLLAVTRDKDISLEECLRVCSENMSNYDFG